MARALSLSACSTPVITSSARLTACCRKPKSKKMWVVFRGKDGFLFLKQQGEELRNCRPGERGTQAGTGRGRRVWTVGADALILVRGGSKCKLVTRERAWWRLGQGQEAGALCGCGPGSVAALVDLGGGEARLKVSGDRLKSVHRQHTTAWPGCWEMGKSLPGLLGSLNALDGCSWSMYTGLRCFPFTTTKRCSPTDLCFIVSWSGHSCFSLLPSLKENIRHVPSALLSPAR